MRTSIGAALNQPAIFRRIPDMTNCHPATAAERKLRTISSVVPEHHVLGGSWVKIYCPLPRKPFGARNNVMAIRVRGILFWIIGALKHDTLPERQSL